MDVKIEQSWKKALAAQWESERFEALTHLIRKAYATTTVYPPASKIFAAFDACPLDKVKVVILGQDPYHGPGMANGLAFSVEPTVAIPRSLANIFREVHSDTGAPIPANGDLTRWARQGVLLLNATLTVEAHKAGSHQRMGWEEFTDAVVDVLNRERSGLVFILWGSFAARKGERIDRSRHLVLTSPHPSPLSASRGFFGNRHFSQANRWLADHGIEPIEW
ncbi:MAG: uracil-DNA glycosylase [Paramuribaculum sp.]|nr:uracil-DNA glycosylase [Paramuribaculum sp.]